MWARPAAAYAPPVSKHRAGRTKVRTLHQKETVIVSTCDRVGQGQSGNRGAVTGKKLGLLLAFVVLVGVASVVGRAATPAAAAAATANLCERPGVACLFLNRDTPDLGPLGWNDRALEAWAYEGPLALYSDVNYQGRCQTIVPWSPVPLTGSWVGANDVSSVRMSPCLATDWTRQKTWIGNPYATGTGYFINDVKVVTGSYSGVPCGDGFSKIATDLNKGAGGAYVYLCVRMTATSYFDTIYAVYADTASGIKCHQAGDSLVPGNLNERAGGKYISFCVRPFVGPIDGHTRALGSVEFNVIDGGVSRGLAEYWGYQRCPTACDSVDLNKGAGGDYIYTVRQRPFAR